MRRARVITHRWRSRALFCHPSGHRSRHQRPTAAPPPSSATQRQAVSPSPSPPDLHLRHHTAASTDRVATPATDRTEAEFRQWLDSRDWWSGVLQSPSTSAKNSLAIASWHASYITHYLGIISLKQASHWRDNRFPPWHAIWHTNEERTRDNVRWICGDAGQVK